MLKVQNECSTATLNTLNIIDTKAPNNSKPGSTRGVYMTQAHVQIWFSTLFPHAETCFLHLYVPCAIARPISM